MVRQWVRWVLLALVFANGYGSTAFAQDRYGPLPDTLAERFTAAPVSDLQDESAPSAVVRLDRRRLVIHDTERSTLFVHRVVTVYDRDGRDYGRLQLWYDGFREIEALEGRLLNTDGEELTELDDEHQQDVSGTRGATLYSDYRVRIAHLARETYPYTVEYRYEMSLTSALHWPAWSPQETDLPVEFAQFVVEFPPTAMIRFHTNGHVPAPETSSRDGMSIMRWRAMDRSRYEPEPYGPSWHRQKAVLRVAPTRFALDGEPGDMSTWQSFGDWYRKLTSERADFPPDAARRIRALVSDAPTRRDSVHRVYRHLQDRSRYVSVQLGIGGWQPFPASYVEERGYGDCKALTNYVEAALRAIGIPAYPVLIDRGNRPRPVDPDFPAATFDHVVLAVPVGPDTLWLENTESTTPFGHIAADIEDRYGLWVGEAGGKLVRTPTSTAADNRQTRTAVVHLNAEGSGSATVRTIYSGNQQDRVRRALDGSSPPDRQEWLERRIDVPSFSLTSVDFPDVRTRQNRLALSMKLSLPRYASSMGSRLFVRLNLMERHAHIPDAVDVRSQPVHCGTYPFLDVDSIRYVLPKDVVVEAVPDPVVLETDFATYAAKTVVEGSSLLYVRRLEWRQETLPPEAYGDLRSFLRTITHADAAQAVLTR